MKIVFFGSDDFAAVHLKALLEDKRHEVSLCVTQPDKPHGRGMKTTYSPIKELALQHEIETLQPDNMKDAAFASVLKNRNCDLFVVIAYGKILPQAILDIPKAGAVNVHSSLLPKYRGAAPINWAVINGEKETGITIIQLNAAMDAGDILSQLKVAISPDDNAQTLRLKMMQVGPAFLLETLEKLHNKQLKPQKQSGAITFAPKLTKELGKISWNNDALKIHQLVRGLIPWPTAYTYYEGKLLKILRTEIIEQKSLAKAGEVVRIDKEGIGVNTSRGILLLKNVHVESSKPATAHDFAIGNRLKIGFQFEG